MMRRVAKKWAPPPKLTTTEWANRYRYLAAESSALPGKYSSALTPWVVGMHEALDDPRVYKVVCQKSAQIAWTDGVLNNWLGRIIDIDPSPVIGLFAKNDAAREYGQEKLGPMVLATPRLRDKMDVATSRKDGNRALFKKFPGGFLKLVGSNSPSNVKSTPAPRVFVEEPDDAAENVGKQGDAIKLLEERTKTYHRRKIVFGGTPSIKTISTIESAYLGSDQRKFYVPCHECGDEHVLAWENVSWQIEPGRQHAIFGDALPDSAVYACPHCGAAWDDHHKNRNVRNGCWIATAEFRGVAGFYINEIYSPFPGSRLARLVERYLEAQHKLDQGDDTDMIVFVNSALGLPYEYKSNAPGRDDLAARAEDYAELTVPAGGLALTAGVDVQHDRLAVQIWAWGRGEESWLVYWGEIAAKVNTIDKNDPVWQDLDKLLFTPIPHEHGYRLITQAVSIDSGDGGTNDAVYHYARARQHRGVMATKGLSADYGQREIYSLPRKIDHKNKTKAAKYGLQVFTIGTHKAKDLLIGDRGRLSLTGRGPGRMHWYKDVRADFYDQITAEVKAPHRSIRGKLIWQPRAGVRNEGLDCAVGALHAARSIKVHVMGDAQWDALEAKLKQVDLFQAPTQPITDPLPSRRRVISKGIQ
jgi:phage terminase large subunit GpA-like protein